MLRDGSTYEMGRFTDAGAIETFGTKDLNFLGSWGFTRNDLPLGIDMLYRTRGKYPWLDMHTIYPFSEQGIASAVADAMAMKTVKSTHRAVAGAGVVMVDRTMLASQRALFEMPRDICYLNAASYSPLPLKTIEAGRAAVLRKGQPWSLSPGFANQQHERTRAAAARLIDAHPDDVALVPSVGYGVSTAAKSLTLPRGSRVLVLENDHSSPVLEWHARARAQGLVIETVRQPDDCDWTSAILATIERPGAPPVSLASISSVHWSDGGLIDVEKVSAALRRQGAVFLIDATHHVGVLDLDVTRLDPDFVMFPTYKWLIGPYGRAFLYIAKRHQNGIPLEQTAPARRKVHAEDDVYFVDLRYLPDARRFDMGERDHFISMEMAAIGMEMMAEWGTSAIVQRLAMLTDRITERLSGASHSVPDKRFRAPHILSLAFKDGMPAGLIEGLASENIYVARRLGRMRVSPHVYNDEADCDRFVAALSKRLKI